MQEALKKFKAKWKLVVGFSLALIILVKGINFFDDDIPLVEQFVESNPQVIDRLGGISNFYIREVRRINTGRGSDGKILWEKKYQIIATGPRGEANFWVVKSTDPQSTPKFTVESL